MGQRLVLPDERSLVRLAMPPDAPPLRLLRTRIAAALAHVTAEKLADIEVAATELVTNAYLHGRHPVEFHMAVPGDGRVRIEVFDAGPALPVVRHPDARTLNGRGLLLVQAFSVRWGVESASDGKTVWAEFALDPSGT